jgi:hypothetical protein
MNLGGFETNEIESIISEYMIIPDKKYIENDDDKFGKVKKEYESCYKEILEKNNETYKELLSIGNKTFRDVRDILYEYCKGKKYILILDREKYYSVPEMAYEILLYCYNAKEVAIDLTELIYKKIKHPFINCKNTMENEEFIIDVNVRSMIKIFSLAPGDASKVKKFDIATISDKMYRECYMMPPEWELIGLYDNEIYESENLALLKDADEYLEIKVKEAKLRYDKHVEYIKKEYDKTIKGGLVFEILSNVMGNVVANLLVGSAFTKITKGGDKSYGEESSDNFKKHGKEIKKINGGVEKHNEYYYGNIKYGGLIDRPCLKQSKSLIDQIKIAIVHDWLYTQNDVILFGTWAMDLWKYGRDKLCINNDRIQLFARRGSTWIFNSLQNFIRDTFGKYNLSLGDEHNVELPDEYRLKRTGIKIITMGIHGLEEFLIIEYFNMLDYAAIPVVKLEKYYLPCKEILLKFFFIQLWSIFNIYHSKSISTNKYLMLVSNIWNHIEKIRESFPDPNFMMGYNIPYVEYRKYLALKSKKISAYFPFSNAH